MAAMETVLEDMRKQMKRLYLLREDIRRFDEKKRLIQLATERCTDETVLEWLRMNSESETFNKLVDMFEFLKKHIDEEEKKNHSDNVHITFVAHGSIRDFMIPARYLLPLPTITDVVLYAPWNCVTSGLGYGVATGKLKPQHRVFFCEEKETCKIPDDKHRPLNLPEHWNSMKKAAGWMIPNITVSPLRPDDGVWKRFESLAAKYGPPGRDRIVIPFILPGWESGSVPFSVVILALSLVLLSSRFKATVHLSSCLRDSSAGKKFDTNYLQAQYACAIDGTWMKCSPDAFQMNWLDYYRRSLLY